MANLREIGLEGFALIDKLYGTATSSAAAAAAPPPPPRRPYANKVSPARQGRWVVQVPNDEMEEPIMNSKEVAARFGGIMAVNYFNAKPQTRYAGTSVRV